MIARVQRLSRQELARDFIARNRPVVMTQQLGDWPARGWTPQGLKKRVASVVVQAQEGNMEQQATRLSEVRMHEYLDAIERAANTPSATQKYAAQFELLETFPELAQDLKFDEVFPEKRLLYTFGWIGPAGTVTGLHKDDSNNLLAQLYGRKKVLLFAPHSESHLYPSRKYDYGARLSYVDAEAPDLARYPRFRHAQPAEIILEAGELLFIPIGWWHQVRSLSPSISVSCFAQSYLEYCRTIPETVRWGLHQLRLLGWREGCTCHSATEGPT